MFTEELLNILTFISFRPRLLLSGFFRQLGAFAISLCLTLVASFLYVTISLPQYLLVAILLVIFLLFLHMKIRILNRSQTSLARGFYQYQNRVSGVAGNEALLEATGELDIADGYLSKGLFSFSRRKIHQALVLVMSKQDLPGQTAEFKTFIRALGVRAFVYQLLVTILLFSPFLAITLLFYPGGETGLLILLLFLGLLFLNFLSASFIEPFMLLWIQLRISAFSRTPV